MTLIKDSCDCGRVLGQSEEKFILDAMRGKGYPVVGSSPGLKSWHGI